jgi:hypothetical protein
LGKNNQKKLLSLVAASMLMTGSLVSVSPHHVLGNQLESKTFKDVKKVDYFFDAVNSLSARKVIEGYKDGTFRPYQPVTRAQAAKIIALSLGLNLSNVKDPGFKDVKKGEWYYPYIAAVSSLNIMSGYNKDEFKPNEFLTRAQMAKILTTAFQLGEKTLENNPFKDVHKEDWYAKYLTALIEKQITKGKTKDMFAPNDVVNRGQIASFVFRSEKAANVQKTGTIKNVTETEVQLDTGNYKIGQSLKGIFRPENFDALKGAVIKFEVENNTIKKVTFLELKNNRDSSKSIVLDGKGVTIDGQIVVSGDYYELRNIIISGNLHITDQVKNSFVTDHLTVKGQTVIADQKNNVKSVNYKTAAEEIKTKVKIIFKDSTIATIEISKKDVYVASYGRTTVTSISLRANAEIFADEDVIIPKVEIKDGATQVELNVTIKDIIIESNDDIRITGKGNVENVVVNTDKKVTLDTRGEIKNLETKKENSKLVIGENAKIGNIELPQGKTAQDIVENFEQIKEKIEKIDGNSNPSYGTPVNTNPSPSTNNPPSSSEDFFDAGILEGSKFGYVKLNIKNAGNYKVKYVVVPREEKDHLPKVGDILTNGIEYKENDEFILWAGHEVFVYLVDNYNKIIDMIDANETWHAWSFFEFTADENKKEITMKTTVKVGDMSPVNDSLKYLYLFNDGVMVKMADFGNLKWEYVDGIPTVKISYSGTEFTTTQPNLIFCSLGIGNHQSGGSRSIVGNLSGSYNDDAYKSLMAFIIKSFSNEDDEVFRFVLSSLEDKDNNVDVKFDSLSLETYKEEIQKNQEATFADLQNIIKQVNENLKDQVGKFGSADEAVSNLFKENRYEYSYGDKNVLKEGLTMDQVKQAEALVKEVSDRFKEKEHLLNDIAYAKYLLNMSTLQENMRKEITVSADKKIQDSLNSLIFPQGIPEGIKVKVQGIGTEKVEDKDHGISYVTGGSKYLGVNENGELILNRINSTGNAVTEYVAIDFYQENNLHISRAIITVTIEPSTEYLDESDETDIISLEEGQSKTILGIYNEDKKIQIQPGTTVSTLLSKIKAEDGSSQTYKVKAEDGTVKGDEDIIQHHDRLIVTAANGKSIAVYDFIVPIILEDIQQGTLGEFIITVNNVSIEELKNTLRVGDPLKEGVWRSITPTITEAKDENGKIIPNQYKVSIPHPKYNVNYRVLSNTDRTIQPKDYNLNMEIVWPAPEE